MKSVSIAIKNSRMSQIQSCTDETTTEEGPDSFGLSKSANIGNTSWVEMLENEKTELVYRVGNLEKKLDEQNDEIVCLRGSLADTLRRITQLEATLSAWSVGAVTNNGRKSTVTSPVVTTPGSKVVPRVVPPTHLAIGRSLNVAQNGVPVSFELNGSFHQKLSQINNTSTPPPQLPLAIRNRCRLSVHESSNSLNSSSIESSNDSTDSQYRNQSATSGSGQSCSAVGSRNGLCSAKRWNSTGDFNHNHVLLSPASSTSTVSRFSTSTKSLLNLNSKSNIRHGTKESIYNPESSSVTTYFRDKPITFRIPTEYLNNNSYDICKVQKAPNYKIELDWVYGYRGRDCRSNLQLLPTGELIYFVSTVVVLYNVEEQQQRHYLEHTDDIKCISIHPKKLLIASGQAASNSYNKLTKAHIRVWNSVNLLTLAVIGSDYFQASISCVSFSKFDGGNLLAAVDENSEHVITLWSWKNGHRLAENKCLSETVLVVDFHPFDNSVLVTCGKTHVNFWSIDVNNTLYKRMGTFEMREKPKYVTCVTFTQNGEIVTGDSNGNLLFWTKNVNKYQRIIKRVHNGALFSICALRDGSFVTGGGKDGRVVQFSSQWIRTGNEIHIEQHFGGVRVIVEGRGSQLFIGTTRNCILSGSFSMGIQPIVLGHTDELFALASHPKLPQFVTGGFDHLLQMWDSLSHNVVWSKEINYAIYSVAFTHSNDDNDDFVVAVGCSNGQWVILNAMTREIVANGCDGSYPLLCAQFSPNNQLLAFGSGDHSIYVYDVSNLGHKYVKVNKCLGHSSGVIKLDWSEDSQYFRTNGADYEMFIWNARTCRQVIDESLSVNIVWATNNCILTFESFGALPDNIQEPMTICCAAAKSNLKSKLLLSGDESGALKLYVYPATQPKCLAVCTKIHRNEVSNVTFLRDEMRAISIGASDTLVAQWNIVAAFANYT